MPDSIRICGFRNCEVDISHRAGRARFCSTKCCDNERHHRDPLRRERLSEASKEKIRKRKRLENWVPHTPEQIAKRRARDAASRATNRERRNEIARSNWPTRHARKVEARTASRGDRFCITCNGALPAGSRLDRLHCSGSCNQRAYLERMTPESQAARRVTTRAWADKAATRRNRSLKQQNREALKRNSAVAEITVAQLEARFAMWGGNCWMCGGEATAIEHVKPIARNGPHILANLRPACSPCNIRKHAKWYGPRELHRFVAVP